MKTVKTSSPGRINIIGEHIDYNDGYVLPAAINLGTEITLELNESADSCTFTSRELNESFTISLKNLEEYTPGWGRYLVGAIKSLGDKKEKLNGFTCEISSKVPLGSGLSSSASLLCSFIGALNELFELGLEKMDIVNAAVNTERKHVGVNCGIMDHFTSVMGKADHAIFLDCLTLEYEYLPLDLSEYELLIINTNVSHSLDTSEYNKRREECGLALLKLKERYAEISNFRDITESHLAACKDILTATEFKRLSHVISETARVIEAKKAIIEKNFVGLGELLFKSHDSLNLDYEVSCEELNFIVERAKADANILGSRMMGGGFGGCTISIAAKGKSEDFVKELKGAYKNQFGINCTPLSLGIGDGLKVLS